MRKKWRKGKRVVRCVPKRGDRCAPWSRELVSSPGKPGGPRARRTKHYAHLTTDRYGLDASTHCGCTTKCPPPVPASLGSKGASTYLWKVPCSLLRRFSGPLRQQEFLGYSQHATCVLSSCGILMWRSRRTLGFRRDYSLGLQTRSAGRSRATSGWLLLRCSAPPSVIADKQATLQVTFHKTGSIRESGPTRHRL